MTCFFDFRWSGEHGIGRFAREVGERLEVVPYCGPGRPMSPQDPFRLVRSLMPLRGPGHWFLSPGYNAPLLTVLPYVLTVHDLNHIDRADNSSPGKRLYYRTVLRRLCRDARAVLTVSNFSRERIIDWFGLDAANVFNVGNGVSEVFSTEGPRFQLGAEYVLCVSNRRRHKNELGVLTAFAAARLPSHVRLVLTGDETPELRAHAQALGIGEALVFSGRVSEKALAGLYRGALCLFFPSFYEGFGLPIVEAFASGTPVISSTVTSLPEVAGDAGLLVDPHDIDAMAQALRSLHDDPALRGRLIALGLSRVPQFSWDAVVKRVRAAVAAVDNLPAQRLNWN